MEKTLPVYQIDERWRIVSANNGFCRALRCTESSLVGRDVRELLRDDWRLAFRSYVARALVGVGDLDATVPLVAPCGEQHWFRHQLEPLIEDGMLAGYRATIQPHVAQLAEAPKRWWEWRPVVARQVWDFDVEQLSRAS
ncbi:MAG: PAS domain-containing protein [Vicinamibacterales bacterium]|jgi:PAS domain-containing protein